MAMIETRYKSKLVSTLRREGALVLSLHGHAQQAPGWPDVYVCHSLWRGWIELKKTGCLLSEAQRSVARKLAAFRLFVLLEVGGDDWYLRDHEECCIATVVPRCGVSLLREIAQSLRAS